MPFNFNPEARPFNPCAPQQPESRPQPAGPAPRPGAASRPPDTTDLASGDAQKGHARGAGASRRNWPAAAPPVGTPPPVCVHGGEDFPPLGAPSSGKAPKAAPRLLPARKSLLTEQLAALAVRENEGKSTLQQQDSSSQGTPIPVEPSGEPESPPHLLADVAPQLPPPPPGLFPPGHHTPAPATPSRTGPGPVRERSSDGPSSIALEKRRAGRLEAASASFRGSPVTTVQVAQAGPSADASSIGVLGPGTFRAIREIGRGAFGKVYLVQSHATRALFAMKVLNKQRVLQKEQVAYAMGERDVMSSLDHPYLVALRYAFQTPHRLFLVMDYIEGGHLWTHMKRGFLAEGVARIFAAEIVLALTHLHALGIAHRDLKPENILLDSDNHCRLTDFGLAKRDLGEDSRAHTMVGTIDYMAPEIVKNEGHGRAVDWWSLGILLYEMLFAHLPFAPLPAPGRGRGSKAARDPRLDPGTDEYKADVKKRILYGKVTWPRGPYTNNVSNAAKNLMQRLLAKSPEQRLRGEAVMQHEFFRTIDWDALRARQVPSPLQSSIFAGAPDKLSHGSMDPAPLERPCPRLAGYLFEEDTPQGSPEAGLLSNFDGFSYVHESELSVAVAAEQRTRLGRAF